MAHRRLAGSYGVDAPWVPWMWVAYAVVYGALAVLSLTLWHAWWWVSALLCVATIVSVLGAALFWYASLRGKFVLWAGLLDSVRLPQNGAALDLGCGHGMVAIMTARRSPSLSVTGIDLWRSVDQSGNDPLAAAANAELNDVADRIRFDTGDMTRLPYQDGTFRLVTASLAIHNINTRDGRRTAIHEAVRVLAPGGTILIADIRRTDEYATELRSAGLETRTRPLGWPGWWSGPWMPTTAVIATTRVGSGRDE
ncbi:class I SAM-dependent methyltransferase [Planctomonas sp. JC2975]|uniref:class I SAM-dependent methyltransferase n=1 Tax=Planctomonas sp. JC2975 TaxID=2729626 RepID=UPI00147414C5|nr:class I SAM-dependent methyltransferase [Planctomonas sp. JC2975]NNC11696.1 class I SAM-dependent methyltransferase [Planctomonas sp. JC2975]